MTAFISAWVAQRRWATPSILEIVLQAADASPLPAGTAGAHIDVILRGGLIRQYSLVDPAPAGSRHYRLGVRVLPDGRGGSRQVAEQLQAGARIDLGRPRNLFALAPARRPVVLVAGGIGITPIHAMASQLRQETGTDWTLHYTFSRREDAYFPSSWLHEDTRVRLHESLPDAGEAQQLDLPALVAAAEARGGADIYCCGPTSLMDALARCCAGRPGIHYTQESFEAPDLAPDGSERPFDVALARSGRTLRVAADRSILDTLREAGIGVPSSCEQGICGACETRVLDGTPLHRDAILSPQEQAAGRSMMICCSRAATPSLTLDI